MNALIAVPKFYTQVLHLMNKMNLPPPFGPVTPTPPLRKRKKKDKDLSSSESELESDEEEKEKEKAKKQLKYPVNLAALGIGKRPKKLSTPSITPEKSKKLKKQSGLQIRLKQHVETTLSQDTQLQTQTQIQTQTQTQKIETTSSQIANEKEIQTPLQRHQQLEQLHAISEIRSASLEFSEKSLSRTGEVSEVSASSRVAEPVLEGKTETGAGAEEEEHRVISQEELDRDRAPPSEISAKFEYAEGEPSTKLYIKNLAKGVTAEDLEYIFGRYFPTRRQMKEGLNVRVMGGRMRGQAFVAFPSVELATEALRQVHGYRLKGQPMVVQFGKQ